MYRRRAIGWGVAVRNVCDGSHELQAQNVAPVMAANRGRQIGPAGVAELAAELPDEGEPVLDDAAFREVLRSLDRLLKPTALA